MWSKKWYLKRNISCDADLLNELVETDVPWWCHRKLRKLWDSLSELRSSLCERGLERTVLRPALLPVKTAQFTRFFHQVWRHSKIAQFNWECIVRFRYPAWTANAPFCVWKTTGKDISEAWAIACQNCTVYSAFPSGMRSHNKIAHFNRECIGRLRLNFGRLERPCFVNCRKFCEPIEHYFLQQGAEESS